MLPTLRTPATAITTGKGGGVGATKVRHTSVTRGTVDAVRASNTRRDCCHPLVIVIRVLVETAEVTTELPH